MWATARCTGRLCAPWKACARLHRAPVMHENMEKDIIIWSRSRRHSSLSRPRRPLRPPVSFETSPPVFFHVLSRWRRLLFVSFETASAPVSFERSRPPISVSLEALPPPSRSRRRSLPVSLETLHALVTPETFVSFLVARSRSRLGGFARHGGSGSCAVCCHETCWCDVGWVVTVA